YGLPAYFAVALLAARGWESHGGRRLVAAHALVFAALALACALLWASDGRDFLESVLGATDVATRKSAAAGQGPPLPSFAEFQPLLADAALVFAAGAMASGACVLVGGGAWARPNVAAFVVLAPMLALLPLIAGALGLVSGHRAAEGVGLELVRRAGREDLIVHEGPLENSGALEWYSGRRAVTVDHRRERLDEALRRAPGSLGVVQVHDGSGVGATENVTHLVLRRHGPEPFGLDRPEHAAFTPASERAEHRGVHHPPRGTEVTRLASRERGERRVGSVDLVGGAPRAAEPQGPMRPAVAPDFVALGDHATHGIRDLRRALAHQEKRSACAAGGEEVQDARCPVAIGTVVEGECDTPGRVAAAPHTAERQHVGAPRVRRPPDGGADAEPRQDHGRVTGWPSGSRTAETIRWVASRRRTRRIRPRSRSRRSGSSSARSSR